MVKIRARQDCPYKGYFRGDVLYATNQNEKEYHFIDNHGTDRCRPKEEFDIVDDQAHVRTVTRKEIVPGTYGIVRVSVTDGCIDIDVEHDGLTAEQAREAAHILNQIAEALEHD